MKRSALLLGLISLVVLPITAAWGGERWVDPRCTPLEITKYGPFVKNDDGSLLVIDKNILRSSTDGGKTWSEDGTPIDPGLDIAANGHVGQFIRTKAGTLIIAFLDMSAYNWDWNNETQGPNPGCKLELWTIRSADGGKTWSDKQRLLDGYNADFMGLVQASNGSIVLAAEHLDPELRRWVVCSFVSDDEGVTWRRGNWIDLGGHGHHDGAVEPSLAELSDGRMLMVIRTNLDRLWSAYSEDHGRYWRVIQPMNLDASSAPPWVLRLQNGHLALVWNRLNPEGGVAPKTKSEGPSSEFPASWFREELSISFSSDDAKTWSDPVVIAREPGGQLAYPYLFEAGQDDLWVITHYGSVNPPLAVRVKESDFLQPVTANP
ncbi:MAG: exo-alpha-sialidase [Candidatus Hydrogenedentes bacterium]|mgnify:CR=1 FL=1|nr:exo-alpha-sialidase [Candidatus Hydrogenedentota bacterium]